MRKKEELILKKLNRVQASNLKYQNAILDRITQKLKSSVINESFTQHRRDLNAEFNSFYFR